MWISFFSVVVLNSALLAAQPFVVGGSATARLVNGSFESNVTHEGWTLHVYGAQPQVTLDAAICHDGHQSLRVTADSPSDTAFGQEIQLKTGRRYRLRGWVRSENLDPRGAPVCGTFQIQHPGGSGTVVTGHNHRGTCDWTEEVLDFTPPGNGRTRIAIFFVGYGKGTGTAWFDQITLEEVNTQGTTLKVTREPLCQGSISPYQGGQFIEYLCALTPSMFAEKVFDGSFEGVPPYGFVFRSQTDRLEQPWYPDGAVNRGEFVLDTSNPFNGKVSQRIRQKSGDPCTLGISQGGKFVKAGEALRCVLHLRAEQVSHPVRVALWGRGKTYASVEFRPTQRWERYEAILTPTGTDYQATFTISFRGPGSLWIDQVSVMPVKTVHGWRTDVAEALKALRPGIVRFGGSTTEGFEWTATIGDPAKRVPFTTCWGGLEPGNAGIEEFVQLCQWVDAEPLICVRFTGKKPKDAADEVEYFNGPSTSPMGKLRAANGHADPYHVKYWQIGNELGDETYQIGLADFCKAMKAVDPTIKLMASFPSPGLLDRAGKYLDYICPHHYGCHDLQAMEANVDACREMIAKHAPGRNIRLGITEWNTTAGDAGLGRAMLWTLDNALACSRYQNFMHRHCDLIEIANRSNLADSFCSGIIQTNSSDLYKTPTYYAQQLYAMHAGRYPLKIQGGGVQGDPTLDISATISPDERRVAIFAVNPTNVIQKRAIDLTVLAPLAGNVGTWTLDDTAKAGERDAANSWREPDRIRTRPGKASLIDGKIVYEFPALSLTALEIRSGNGVVGGTGYRTVVGDGDARIPVVLVHGTPYEMGWHLGRLTRDDIKRIIPKTMTRFKQSLNVTDEKLQEVWTRSSAAGDDRFKQELAGLSDGAEVPLSLLQAAHAIPLLMPYSCSSVAAWGKATEDGHLYQTRNLDWKLSGGLHDFPVVVVYLPEHGIAHVVPTFAGIIGAHTGMNARGIVLAQMGDSPAREAPYDLDAPHFMTFFRSLLYDADSLSRTIEIFKGLRHTKRYHYVFGDGQVEHRAVKIRAHSPEPPDRRIIIWKDNDPQDEFAPRVLEHVVYNDEGRGAFPLLKRDYGLLNADKMIHIANQIPIRGGNVVNVVYDATALQLWVSYAKGDQEAYRRPYTRVDLKKMATYEGGTPDLQHILGSDK